jgi:AAA+ superfamily predicted ATPase
MNFDPTLSFSDNLARFRAEAERIDADCARILFDNLALLARDGDATSTRQAVQEFNRAVLTELDGLPEEPAA